MIRFLTSDSVTTMSTLYAVTLAWFRDDTLRPVIALLLLNNLMLGIAVNIKKIRRE